MKLFLIDGHALIFKMYYAFLGRPMINAKGVDTSILFGFTKYLLELIRREQPTHIAVGFDPPGGTFRNQLYPEYKANRGETPQLVIDALEPLTQIVKSLNIPVLMIPGYEADDVLGSMAKRSAREGFDVYMVTPDKDYGQLLDPHIFQVKPGKKGGDDELFDIPRLQEKYGISRPDQIIDMLAICGDASDNVPGVKGVGEVGASKLLQKYDTLEGIYEHLGELTARQQELFRAAEDHIALSKTLVTIKTDIPIDTSADDMALRPAGPSAIELFNLYGFNSLKKYLGGASGEAVPSEPVRGSAAHPSQPGGWAPPSNIAEGGMPPGEALPARKATILQTRNEIMEACRNGILITDFCGGNSNPATGDFSYAIQGYRFKDGKIVHPVREMLITGNIVDLWSRLLAAGTDARRCRSKLTPTLAFDNVDFSG